MAEDRRDPAAEPEGVHYVKEALKWQYNWIGLLGAAAFAVVSGSSLPLVMAAGLELIYLSLVPQSSRFRRLVRSWKYAEEKRRQEERLRAMFLEIPSEMRNRYGGVDMLCRAIRENYGRLCSTSQIFVRQMEERLVGLRRAYLRLLHAAHQHREHLKSTSAEAIRRELADLERALPEDPPKVQEINRKRLEIMTKRLEKYEKARENCAVIDAQCAAIEDVLKLIRDQSVTLRDPQQVSEQLDALVSEVEQTEETVRQVEAMYHLEVLEAPELFSPLSSGAPSPQPESGRRRIRS